MLSIEKPDFAFAEIGNYQNYQMSKCEKVTIVKLGPVFEVSVSAPQQLGL
jgi:hypothetical protein